MALSCCVPSYDRRDMELYRVFFARLLTPERPCLLIASHWDVDFNIKLGKTQTCSSLQAQWIKQVILKDKLQIYFLWGKKNAITTGTLFLYSVKIVSYPKMLIAEKHQILSLLLWFLFFLILEYLCMCNQICQRWHPSLNTKFIFHIYLILIA